MFRKNKSEQIDFDEIITEKDIVHGNVILIFGRPAMGKTETCYKICEKYVEKYNVLYFSLDGNDLSYRNKGGGIKIINEFETSVKIVKTIEKSLKADNVKFVVIDGWELLEDKGEWIRQKIINFAIKSKVIFLITENIPRSSAYNNFLTPLYKQIKRIDERLNDLAFKEIVVSINDDNLNKSYYKYNDIFN